MGSTILSLIISNLGQGSRGGVEFPVPLELQLGEIASEAFNK
jgi:hypothetical protein